MEKNDIFTSLNIFFEVFRDISSTHDLSRDFFLLNKGIDNLELLSAQIDYLQPIYEKAIQRVEKEAADKGFREDLLVLQRDLYKELENILSFRPYDPRHHFLVVVPVADRPAMLKNCVRSLIEHAGLYNYGGVTLTSGSTTIYNKISLFIIDDSGDESNIAQIKAITDEAKTSGIRTYYIGLDEQAEVLCRIPAGYRERLSGLTGEFTVPAQPHKGASITRNIAYLYLLPVFEELEGKKLVYFLDSDEEFKIKIRDGKHLKDTPFINYFYWIDRIFSSSDIEVLTGKVVGDPPVSPSVMINTFLDDLAVSLEELSETGIDNECRFHESRSSESFSAEYHDMVQLFGYQSLSSPKKYQCSLTGSHTAHDCIEDLSGRALGFFYGLHPTRPQLYNHPDDFLNTDEARTVYTGNYVFNANGFRHFIPFAGLKLRMAGPALGRILRQRLKHRFVSASLPLLHKRTSGDDYKNEFRSGLLDCKDMIDLSGEYNRQFWGDVMLFSVECLTSLGYPDRCIELEVIANIVYRVQNRIWELYREQQNLVEVKIQGIAGTLSDPQQWWNADDKKGNTVNNFRLFCSSVLKNFGNNSPAAGKISSQIAEGFYTSMIINAIYSFYEDDLLWNDLLKPELFVPSVCQEVCDPFSSDEGQ